MLTKKVIKFLKENGYLVKEDKGVLLFTKPRDITLLFILSGFSVFTTVLISVHNMTKGLMICAIIGLLTFLIAWSLRRSPFLKIDLSNGVFYFGSLQRKINSFSKIFMTSNFESEHTSTFKETSEEYVILMKIQADSDPPIDLLCFKFDNEEIKPEIHELYDFFKKLVEKSKSHE